MVFVSIPMYACEGGKRNLAMSEDNAMVLSENEEYKLILAAVAAHSSAAGVLEHVRTHKRVLTN